MRLGNDRVGIVACSVRQLSPSDIPLMRALLAMFAASFDDEATYTAAVPGDAYLGRLLGREHFIGLVATKGDNVVGGLAAYVLDKFEQERSEIYIYDLAVATPHRRQGIATALIERLKEIGAARGAWVIFVQGDYGDDPAIALYTRLGAREDVMHFDIAIGTRQSKNPI